LRGSLFRIAPALLLVWATLFAACTRFDNAPIISGGVDAYISPQLPAHDRSVMRAVMSLLRPSQWQNVVFFDVAGDGRIYANRPELLSMAFYYRPVPGHPGLYADPLGGAIRLPPNPGAPSSVLGPDYSLPSADSTGPFHRLFVNDTSWMANAVDPGIGLGGYPIPYNSWYDSCNDYVFNSANHGQDSGYVYTGAYANTQKSNPSQVEFGVGISSNTPQTGFSTYMAVSPKTSATPTVTGFTGKYGCFFNGTAPNLIFSVVSSTMVEGVFAGDVDKRPCSPSCYPPNYQKVTYVESVPQGDGFNLSGTNMVTYLNVSIAQDPPSPIPKGYPGYVLDGSYFHMDVLNNGSAGYGELRVPARTPLPPPPATWRTQRAKMSALPVSASKVTPSFKGLTRSQRRSPT